MKTINDWTSPQTWEEVLEWNEKFQNGEYETQEDILENKLEVISEN